MEAKFGEKLHNFYDPVVSDLKGLGKKTMEWDLNDWRWDGDLFMAAPLNLMPSDCRSKQLFPVGSDIPVKTGPSTSNYSSGSDEVLLRDEREKGYLEKRRRYVEMNEQVSEEGGSLHLMLGGQVFPVLDREVDRSEEKSGKKTKVSGAPLSRAVCQVEDCRTDLSDGKDYHRRHKVCELHSKATKALVGNTLQRFCQQCSRFHVLQEFDEGKRSCRRRLAGHNKRRRKTHPENATNAAPLNDEQSSHYLLISLLRILSNIQSSSSSQPKDQDLLSHLLRSLGNLAGSNNESAAIGLLPPSQDLQKDVTQPPVPDLTRPTANLTPTSTVTNSATQGGVIENPSVSQKCALPILGKASNSAKSKALETTLGKTKLNNIDLNNVYDVSQDSMEDLDGDIDPENLENASTVVPFWLCKNALQSSPPQNSGNSDLTPSQSPSTSNGEDQCRTDRIVFKLFGKDPSHFPPSLRKQILDWLSSSPIDLESYIRPGCVVLTIYLRMNGSVWEELYRNLYSNLRRLLDSSNESFWRTGWIYARVQHHTTFVYNGQIVLDAPFPLRNHGSCRISSITPIAVPFSEDVRFVVKGFNLSRATSRLLCALQGKYLVLESCADMTGGTNSLVENEEFEHLSFSCVIPNVFGRGFIEVEDHGLSGSFFPFIVAEKDICSEIRNLENIFNESEAADGDVNKLNARDLALDFVHELGWLFHKSSLISRLGEISDDIDLFPFKRFKWLIEFAIDRDWSAVVKKLLNLLLHGDVDAGEYASIQVALQEIGLLHRAVRKNSRAMIEVLLAYRPDKTGYQEKLLDEGQYLFRPDMVGHGGLTPLHIAASLDSSENLVDALTDDPGSVGLEAWTKAQDGMGLTPHDYASLRGHYSYIHLVRRKMNKKSGKGQVVIDIPQKISKASGFSFETEKHGQMQCRECEQKMAYGGRRASVTIYRPAMLSMVAIAAVCVCAALLFKSSPEVVYLFRPFRWELLKYGSE